MKKRHPSILRFFIRDDSVHVLHIAELGKSDPVKFGTVHSQDRLPGRVHHHLLSLGKHLISISDPFFHIDALAGKKCLIRIRAAEALRRLGSHRQIAFPQAAAGTDNIPVGNIGKLYNDLNGIGNYRKVLLSLMALAINTAVELASRMI